MNDARTFLTTLFADYPTDGDLRLEIRPLWPAWRKEEFYPDGDAPWYWACDTPSGTREWFRLTPQGIDIAVWHSLRLAVPFEVYMGVLPRVGRHGKQENVSLAGWLWCDVDGGTEGVEGARRILAAANLPEPTMIIVSGGGLHVYWRLSEIWALPDADVRFRFKMLLKRLCLKIGGDSPAAHADSSRADTASILRVPETNNNKLKDAPRVVTLDHYAPDAASYPLCWWAARLPALPAPPPPSTVYADTVKSCEGLMRWARKPLPEGKRHQDLVSAAAWLIRDQHIAKTVALDLLCLKAAASFGTRRIPREELEAMIEWC